ncbi:MAG: hypothetical protein IPK07_31120 [Deltaproteobacteria bacterium]|nr:hypothetical protein [Deltaproteobacteria bacterium]
MIVPAWAWWFTYLAVPVVAALLATLRRLGRGGGEARPARLARVRKAVAFALGISALCNAFDFLRMLGDVSGFGSLVYLAILASQAGLATTLSRTTPPRTEAGFALVAVAMTITMLLVRAQVIWIFA